jgi:hypothetical protein
MGDMENYFLVFIGILVICLIVSVLLFKPNIGGQFGFKKINGRCLKVNEAPRGVAGQDGTVYSNAFACQQTFSAPFECVGLNGNKRECVKSSARQEGVYETQAYCQAAC